MARRAPGSWRRKRKRRSVRKKVHQDIDCQAFWRALSVTKGPYNSEGRQVWMGWEYGKWQRGRSVSEWHQTFIRVLKRASRPDGRCTVKCMLLQKGPVNYCGCISRIEGAYIRIVGASAPTKRYKITPLLQVIDTLDLYGTPASPALPRRRSPCDASALRRPSLRYRRQTWSRYTSSADCCLIARQPAGTW